LQGVKPATCLGACFDDGRWTMMNKAYGQSNKPSCELVVGSPRKSCEAFYQCRTILFWEVVEKFKRFLDSFS